MAKHFAARVEPAGGVEEQVAAAFRLALARPPSDAELRTLADYARRHGQDNACRVLFNHHEVVLVD
jgi:hypothetical protein